MDTLLTPSGDDIMRHTITSQTHVYQIPGYAPVTNVVPVLTNSVHLRMKLVEVETELPPVPTNSFQQGTIRSRIVTENAGPFTLESTNVWRGGYEPPPFNLDMRVPNLNRILPNSTYRTIPVPFHTNDFGDVSTIRQSIITGTNPFFLTTNSP